MTDLQVTTSYLEELAAKHDLSSADVRAAAAVTSGIGSTMWTSHGVICATANMAVAEAESARSAANAAVESVGTEIAKRLRAAGGAYDGTDERAGESLDAQVLPR